MERKKVTIDCEGESIVFNEQSREEILKSIRYLFTEWKDKHITKGMFVFFPSTGYLPMAGIDINDIFGIRETRYKYYIFCKSHLLIIYYRAEGTTHVQSPKINLNITIKKRFSWQNLWYWLIGRDPDFERITNAYLERMDYLSKKWQKDWDSLPKIS